MSDQLLLGYSVLDGSYKNGSVRYVQGLQDAAKSTVGTIANPRESGVPLLPSDPDPKLFSYAYKGGVRVLVSKVVSPVSGSAPYTTWSLYEATADGFWVPLAKDIALYTAPNVQAATNAYGVAHLGDWLYIVDYDSQKIYTLGTNELNGLADGSFYKLTQAALDLGPDTTADLPANAKGQAIIALRGEKENVYLFALYINLDASYQHSPGYLARLTVDTTTGAPAYDTQTEVGMNPQEIIPLTKTDGTVTLVIPSVGGSQQAGGSNGVNSMIQSVAPFAGTWPATANILITGATSGTYDIFAIAAPDRPDDNGIVYILTYDYTAGYAGTDWTLYSTTVTGLLNQKGGTLPANFKAEESGKASPGYFWNILFETGADPVNDRLWFFRGSPLLATPALAYAPPPQTGVTNRFFDVGNDPDQIGGQNVDWADLIVETIRQTLAGKSLKHSVRAARSPAAEEEKK
jgi:hypothetical protein